MRERLVQLGIVAALARSAWRWLTLPRRTTWVVRFVNCRFAPSTGHGIRIQSESKTSATGQ